MSFVTALALAVALFVAAPVLAHRLRRQRADVVPFAAAHLVVATPPKARKRARLDDRALLVVRALAVVVLALLGATPLVTCSHLALERDSGASVALALVLDDSGSMRAPVSAGQTRFAAAIAGAEQLLASAREGDAVAIVLAGAPPRILLAPTTDLGAVRAALRDARPSDRATELVEALAMAEGLLAGLPQIDKKLVVLSDRADGHPEGAPLGASRKLPVWIPLPELAAKVTDCAVITADRAGLVVRVRVACTPGETFAGRAVEVRTREGDRPVGTSPGIASSATEVSVTLAADAPDDLVARLAGDDAIASNDAAPVLSEAGPTALAIIADPSTETVVTGGNPVVEQAYAALHTELAIRPLPQLPDRLEDLTAFAGVVVDDPPGLTPEQRSALGAFLQRGGVALFALGPRSAQAPLGANFAPVLTQGVTWGKNPGHVTSASSATTSATTSAATSQADGANPKTAHALFAEAAPSLSDLAAPDRATVSPADASALETLLAFSDGSPLVARRAVGAGVAWIVTLPFSVNDSDLVLRPGFLSLLDAFSDAARSRATQRRTEVGVPWLLREGPGGALTLKGPDGQLVPTTRDADGDRVSPGLVGWYTLQRGAERETRLVSAAPRELDTRPREAAAASAGEHHEGSARTKVDLSWVLALALLALLAAELGLRVAKRPTATSTS